MRMNRARSRRCLAALAAVATAVLVPSLLPDSAGAAGAKAAAVTLPPAHAGFDYQIGGPYTPPAGVSVVSRDHTATPAAGLYNICYINAFQVQPGAEGEWASDLLLRKANGSVVYDEDWGEALLDLRTADKRQRIANKVDTWINECASKGYQAIEPDNYDSYSRSGGLLTSSQAESYITLLSSYAHTKGLAAGQKNTSELAGDHQRTGLDFGIAEECGAYNECGDYTAAFGNHVVVIEYTAKGLKKACSGWGSQLSIVRRDVDVTPKGESGYVRQTC